MNNLHKGFKEVRLRAQQSCNKSTVLITYLRRPRIGLVPALVGEITEIPGLVRYRAVPWYPSKEGANSMWLNTDCRSGDQLLWVCYRCVLGFGQGLSCVKIGPQSDFTHVRRAVVT